VSASGTNRQQTCDKTDAEKQSSKSAESGSDQSKWREYLRIGWTPAKVQYLTNQPQITGVEA